MSETNELNDPTRDAGLSTPEPAPQPSEHPAVWDLVMADMRQRDGEGRKKYGTRAAMAKFAFEAATNRPLVEKLQALLAEKVASPDSAETIIRLLVLHLARSEAHRAQSVARELGLVGEETISAHWWVEPGEVVTYDFSRRPAFIARLDRMGLHELLQVGLKLTMLEDPIGPNGVLTKWLPEVASAFGLDVEAVRATLPVPAVIEPLQYAPLSILNEIKGAPPPDAPSPPTGAT